MKKVVTNIEAVKKQVPALMRKCLSYFMGVDRTVEGWEGLLAAQESLPNNKIKDEFAADYRSFGTKKLSAAEPHHRNSEVYHRNGKF